MKPELRKPLGVLGLVAGLALYAALVASVASTIGALPVVAQGVVYLALGIVWIVPLGPYLRWLETGHWR